MAEFVAELCYIGIAAANVVSTLHPDMIVLGSGVAEIGDLLTTTVRKRLPSESAS